ncbi:MAG: hypothetical protein IGQ45_13490 [Cyanobacterium sp. T60_A2020_053]|nr:hypothetical protein [Cyanobacterium sp. T60_A2020_053]
MNEKSNNKWEEKLEQIEAEIYDSTPLTPPNNPQKSVIPTVKNWFLALPTAGKVIIAVFGIMLLLSLVNTVFSIVKFVFGIAVLGLVIYTLSRFINNKNNNPSS